MVLEGLLTEHSAGLISAPMDLEQAARCLEKLGNATRLKIYRLLVRAGPAGLAVGELQAHLEVPASTLSHHVAQLVHVGLVRQDRQGRVLRCTPDFARMDGLISFLTEECCRGVTSPPDTDSAS